MIIGVTGGTGAGKSTVSKMIAEKGAFVIDADEVARELMSPGSPILNRIADRFGKSVINEDCSLNRKALGSIIFTDEIAKRDLNEITHPSIIAKIKELVKENKTHSPDQLIVIDAPLLIDTPIYFLVDRVILVWAKDEVRLGRLMLEKGLTEGEARIRMEAQTPAEELAARANFIIINHGSLGRLRDKVDEVLAEAGVI
ncbi:MAG: dephospho-CoA kinase [Actinomycetota bacterium]|nr:dephospho-CoA kinase [Actinomycetota bacterium]